MNTINKIPEITHLLDGSDYVDVKTVEGRMMQTGVHHV